MYHLIARYKGSWFYICAFTEKTHIKTIRSIYENQFTKAIFDIIENQMGRNELSNYNSCLDFVKAYIAKEHLAETIGD